MIYPCAVDPMRTIFLFVHYDHITDNYLRRELLHIRRLAHQIVQTIRNDAGQIFQDRLKRDQQARFAGENIRKIPVFAAAKAANSHFLSFSATDASQSRTRKFFNAVMSQSVQPPRVLGFALEQFIDRIGKSKRH